MAAYQKFQCFVEDVAEKKHNLASDQLKVALTNTLPLASQTVFDGVTNHPPPAAANGYPAGGGDITTTSSGQAGGTYSLVLVDYTFTATAGGIGPFRYAVFYNDTAATDPLIWYVDYGSSITLADTETLLVAFNGAGALTLA